MKLPKTTNQLNRRNFIRSLGIAASGLAILPASGFGYGIFHRSQKNDSVFNPTPHNFRNEPIRLKLVPPRPSGSFIVRQGDVEIPYQVEEINGEKQIWVCVDSVSGEKHQFEVVQGNPKPFQKKVTLTEKDGFYILENRKVSVKIPAGSNNNIPGPIAGIKLSDGILAGSSFWKTNKQLKKYSAIVIGDGTIFAKLRLRYEFEGMTGANNDIPAFAEIDITLAAEWEHISIFERHEMGPDDYWEFEMSHGWSPRKGKSKQFNNGPGGEANYLVPPMDRDLVPFNCVSFAPDLYINLIPRWNQHFKDGWAFAATNEKQYMSVVVVKASQWKWPHDNNLQCVVKPEGNYAGVRCSTWRGQRLWWLSPSLTPMDTEYIRKNIWENLDKINHDYIPDWPGKTTKWWSVNPYDSEQTNPTHAIRQIGKAAMKNAGQPADDTTLIRFQTLIHRDSYGSYWDYFSPENPNFFTDYNLVPIALATNLKNHPQFEVFRKLAENKFKEDLYHSITLPGGAGQECPGYSHYGMSLWREIVELGEKHLGFDMKFINERLEASEKWYQRMSYPDGDIRRGSSVGDSHSGRDGMRQVEVDENVVNTWKTEELPGFGVIFTNHPGTERETYFSFKSGPNRCHYHGDQLAFHYCAKARPLVVDHRCSFRPRPGQEHMHNRLAFFTDDMPYANMDGYERVLAVKTSEYADIAIGQVESNRLRKMEQFPPEIWDTRYPQLQFNEPLVYRRTVVMMKNGDQDYFVFRDQYRADRPLKAACCLHTYGETPVRKGPMIDFEKLVIYCTHPDFSMKNFDWSHQRGGLEETKGIRLEISGQSGEMITVMYPGSNPPEMSEIPGGIQIGNDTIVFNGNLSDFTGTPEVVSISRSGKKIVSLSVNEIDSDRWQGEVGLFVPDAGYPFGDIPEWLARQRTRKPDWASEL